MSYNDWLNKNNSNVPINVYVGGYYYIGVTGNYPCYWKNGNRVNIPYLYTGYDTGNWVNSIYIDGNDVYCAGSTWITLVLIMHAIGKTVSFISLSLIILLQIH